MNKEEIEKRAKHIFETGIPTEHERISSLAEIDENCFVFCQDGSDGSLFYVYGESLYRRDGFRVEWFQYDMDNCKIVKTCHWPWLKFDLKKEFWKAVELK